MDVIEVALPSPNYPYPRQLMIQMLYISTSVWVLHTPNTIQHLLLPCFYMFWQDFDAKMKKNHWKAYKFVLFPKTGENNFSDVDGWSEILPREVDILICFTSFWEWVLISPLFGSFFFILASKSGKNVQKNMEQGYFDQHLKCVSHKYWSKYTKDKSKYCSK